MYNTKTPIFVVLLFIASLSAIALTNGKANQQVIQLQEQIKLLSAEVENLKNNQPANINDIRYEADRAIKVTQSIYTVTAMIVAIILFFLGLLFNQLIPKHKKDFKALINSKEEEFSKLIADSTKDLGE